MSVPEQLRVQERSSGPRPGLKHGIMLFDIGDAASSVMSCALDLPGTGLLAIVGAGGKTSLMFRLAAELTAGGARVACTTTTRIFPPAPDQARLILEKDNARFLEECRETANQSRPACLAWAAEGAKLRGLTTSFINDLVEMRIFDWILVEADGARRLPIKAPADHEPVIPACSTHVLAVAGLTAIGTPLDEQHVCRSERYAKLSGLALGDLVTPASVARLCTHPKGMFKCAPSEAVRLLWLNQADVPGAFERGREILRLLCEEGSLPHRAVLGAANHHPCVQEVWS